MPSKVLLFTRDQYETWLDQGKTCTEILPMIGLRAAGGNFRTLYKHLKQWHLLDKAIANANNKRQLGLSKEHKRRLRPLEEVLVENSTYSRHNLKKRLLKNGLLENRCYKCNLTSLWQGEPISLQLDHINGIWNDNRIENLRILCPNCHSQTHTFAGKFGCSSTEEPDTLNVVDGSSNLSTRLKLSRSKTEYKCECGSIVSWKAKQCRNCYNKSREKIAWPSTQHLQTLVQKHSFLAVGRQLGVSDNAIRKRLKRKTKS